MLTSCLHAACAPEEMQSMTGAKWHASWSGLARQIRPNPPGGASDTHPPTHPHTHTFEIV